MNKTFFLSLFFIFLFSSLNLTDGLHTIGVYLVYIILILLIIMPLFIRKLMLKTPGSLIMYFFFLFCVISSLINSDWNLVISAFMVYMLFIVSCNIFSIVEVNHNKIIFYSFLISHIPLVVLPIIVSGIDSLPYQGIFYNPNSFGTVVATTFIIIFSRFLTELEEYLKGNNSKKATFFIYIFLLIFVFYLIVISSSRTSFLATILCVFIGLFYLSINLFKYKKVAHLFVRGGIFTMIIFMFTMLIFRFTNLREALTNNIFSKFESRFTQGSGVLASRDEIWHKTITEAGLFGQGNYYFVDLGIGAHNTFISILGNYGWLPLSSIMVLLLIIFYSTSKYSLSNISDRYKYLPIMIYIIFIAMSMGEDMTFKVSMILMFFSFGSILQSNKLLVGNENSSRNTA